MVYKRCIWNSRILLKCDKEKYYFLYDSHVHFAVLTTLWEMTFNQGSSKIPMKGIPLLFLVAMLIVTLIYNIIVKTWHHDDMFLNPLFDITEHIYLPNQTYNIKASFRHVYEHQDTRSRGKISAEAILDVQADWLAGEYQDELGAYSPIIYYHPHDSCTHLRP